MRKPYQLLKNRIRTQRPVLFILSTICNVFIFIYSACTAFCIREILNSVQDGTARNTFTNVLPWFIGIIISGIIRIFAIRISALLDSVLRFEAENTIRHNIFLLALKRKDIRSLSVNSNKVYEVLDDDVPKCVFPALLLTEVLGYVCYTIAAIVTLVMINWRVTLFIFIPLSMAILMVQFLSKQLKANRLSNRKIHEQITETVAHVSEMARIIKLSGSEEHILKYYNTLNAHRRRIALKDKLFDSITRAATSGTVYIGTAIMMFMVARSMMEGHFSLGDFSIFITYLGTLTDCVNRILELVTESHQSEVSYERLTTAAQENNPIKLTERTIIRAFKKITNYSPEIVKRIPLYTFSVRNLNYQNAMTDISFCIKKGELLVICGEVGCGKSTVAGALTSLFPVDSGEIFWNGIPFTEQTLTSPNILFTPQNPGIFSSSIRENLLLGANVCEKEIEKALYDAVLEQDIALMENGIDTAAGNHGDMLSGGQKQRLALARMFLRNPELCVLDDSTSALDAVTECYFVIRLQEQLKRNSFSCIAISNRKAFLESADNILVMKSGRIIASGNAKELSDTNQYFHEIYSTG